MIWILNRLRISFPALSHRNYRLFWFGQCISLIGTWMQNIGQAWLVLQLTSSPFKLGIVSAIQYLPLMFFSLFAGTLVDRFPKKKVLLVTQTSLMILAAILATLTAFGIIRYWHVLIMAFFLGIINTLDIPTRQSFIVELVGRDDLMNAIALNSTVFNLGRILGPAVAGIMIGLVGISVCFYINSISFIPVIFGIMLIRLPVKNYTAAAAVTNIVGNFTGMKRTYNDIAEGLRYVLSTPMIKLSLLLMAILSIFVMNFNVLIPVYAKQALELDSTGYGFLMTSMGAGSLLAALTIATNSRNGPKPWVLLTGAAGMSLFLPLLGLSKSYIISCAILFVTGFFTIIFSTSVNTMIQLNSDDDKRGRVMSMYTLVFGGLSPIGSLYAGKVSETAGIAACLLISGTIGIISVIGFTIFNRKWNNAR